ncbi:hypothetical protein [Neogemmobacter tilapiae]|nr:hypothetical protein [Gemmobacter tilapiae]
MFRIAALLMVLASPVLAQETPLTIEEFDALVTGRKMDHFNWGQSDPYGAEVYLPNRTVRWAFTADECVDGTYYERDGAICFNYEGRMGEICWHYWRDGADSLTGRPTSDPADSLLYQMRPSTQKLACLGPDVGV